MGVEKVDTDTVKTVRQMTGGGEEGEQVLHQVQERGLSQPDVREVKKRVERGQSVDTAIEQVSKEKLRKKGLSEEEVRQVQSQVEEGASFQEAVQQATGIDRKQQEAFTQARSGGIKVRTEITFTGDYASAIQRASKDRGASENQIARVAIENWLEKNGYL